MANRYPLVLNGSTIQELQSGDAVAGLIIGTDVQAYDADTAKYDDATANFTGTLQQGGNNVLTTAAIGSSVQAYDADLTSWAAIAPAAKQDALVSGTNIKTINSTSLLGSGNITTGDVTLTGAQTLTNKTLTDPAIIGTILEDVYTISDGAAFEIDPGNGSIQLITLGASRTPKATNFAAGESVILMVDDGTAYTLTWTDATFGGSGVVWKTNGGVAPTLNTSGYTVIVLWKVSTQVYGARVGDA